MGFINRTQQAQDHKGLRNHCAADGHPGTAADPLALSDTGSRIHQSHFDDPKTGFFGRKQKD